jgi:hypothetical protein
MILCFIQVGTLYCHVSTVPWLIITGSGLDLLELRLQSPLITINYESSWSTTKTRSTPYWTTSVFPSAVTDLVLIYESVTSAASVIQWLTLHSWILDYWTEFWILLRMNEWILGSRLYCECLERRLFYECPRSQSQSNVTTDGQSASLSWNKAPIWGLRPDLYYWMTVAGLLMSAALSDERTCLSFARIGQQ